MKRLALILAVLLTLALPLAAHAAGPLDDIDAEVNGWLPRLAIYQNNYAGQNGRYYQMLWSHTAAPSTPTAPNNLLAHPDDQVATGQSFWLSATMPATPTYRIRVDTYSGPTGAGYVTVLETSINGQSWLKMVNFGPETWRNSDWFNLSDEF